MLSVLVRFAIERRAVVLAAACALVVYGLFALSNTGLDVFPEFAPKLVVVQTEAPGLSAEQVEVLVTQRLESALGGLIGLDHLRSESIAGLSVVTAVFDERSDTFRDRNQVAERLAVAAAELPVGVGVPVIAPLASSSATVRTIGLTVDGDDPLRLRDVAARIVAPRVLGTRGVADVNLFGGAEPALLVEPRPAALTRLGVSVAEVVAAVRGASADLALGAIENANQQIAITGGVGALGAERLAGAVVRRDGVRSITLGEVATLRHGALPRISAAQIGGRPAVVMMVIGQLGANTLTVSRALDALFDDLAPVLAAQQVTLHPRLFVPADYVTTAIGDISRHLLVGGVLVLLVLLVGLYDARTALIAALAIPLSLLTAVIVLIACGVQLNVLVIGGLAIALGEVVDDAIIDTENIFRRLRGAPPHAAPAAVALAASLEVRGSVVYATFIVALVFAPLLTLGGVSGRLFAPLGLAYILAVLASLLVAVTVTPALCVSLLGRARHAAREAPVFRWLNPRYALAVGALARRPALALAATALSVVAVAVLLPGLGARLLPELREGHFIVHTTGLPGTSLDESLRMGTRLTEQFLRIPGVVSVSQWAGRAARGADTYGSHYSEYEVALAPAGGAEQQRVLEALRAVLASYPGITYEANTFLTERIDETISGYAAPVVIHLYGSDLDVLDAKALELAALVRAVPGAEEVRVRAAYATPNLEVTLDPRALARHGLDARVVLEALQAGYGGLVVNETYVDNRRLPIGVLLDAGTRADAARLGELVVAIDEGGPLRLAQLATIRQVAGRYNILHREAQRLQVVTADVADGDVAGFVRALRAQLRSDLRLPEGLHLEFGGAAVEQAEARRNLVAHAAIAGVGVLLLIQLAVGRARYVALILLNLPFSLLGGVLAVLADGGVVSVGSVVGFVTLFGITVRNSIMLVSHYQHLVEVEGCAWGLDTALRGACERLPAILMTALVTALAMLPLTVDSDNPGREIMGPMAAIIVGGLVSSTLLNLLVMPALLYRYGGFGQQPAARL
ncbi:MAG: efflux RND transporter permease subunit [Gammaproteobacteria bacterium]